jgi:dynein assembly factor 2
VKIPFPPLKEDLEAKPQKAKTKARAKFEEPTQPDYTIVHRGEFSMQDFTNSRESTLVKRPKELVVRVELPGVESTTGMDLDIFEKKVVLKTKKPQFLLDVSHGGVLGFLKG